jgi:hypothetical protein
MRRAATRGQAGFTTFVDVLYFSAAPRSAHGFRCALFRRRLDATRSAPRRPHEPRKYWCPATASFTVDQSTPAAMLAGTCCDGNGRASVGRIHLIEERSWQRPSTSCRLEKSLTFIVKAI